MLRATLVLALALLAAPAARGQSRADSLLADTVARGGGTDGGRLTPRVSFSAVDVTQGRGARERKWLRAVVLWRGQPDWTSFPRTARAAAELGAASRRYTARSRAAEDSGRFLLGGAAGAVDYGAEIDRTMLRLTVLGRTFALPARDSALVVMVDHVDGVGGAPSIVGTAHIGAALPPRFWSRQWESGDTLFVLRASDRRESMLVSALRRSPVVRPFLE